MALDMDIVVSGLVLAGDGSTRGNRMGGGDGLWCGFIC